MRTLPMYGQLFRPAQETGIVKEQSLAFEQQISIEHCPELAMNHGNFLYGPVGAEFSRLTEHLVFAFLGGYVSMDDLPCLGDLTNGIDGFYRTTSSSMSSYLESSKAKSLDPNDNLHQLSAISMGLDFIPRIMDDLCKSAKTIGCYQKIFGNISIVLDSLDAFSPPEHTSQSTDEIELLPENSINAHLYCNKSVVVILNLDHPTPSMPFQQCDFTGKVVLRTIDAGLPYCSLGSNSDPDTLFKKLAFKLQKINVNRTTEIQEDALINHHHESNSGNFESQFHRHHKNSYDVPVSNLCPTTASKNRPINYGTTFSIPNPATLIDYLYGDLEIPQFLDTESTSMQSEDSCCIIGNNGEGPTFSVPDPSKLMNFLYGNLVSPVFLSSESIEEEVPIDAVYDGNYSKVEMISRSADHAIEESHQCSAIRSSAVPETIAGLTTESLCDSNGFTNEMDFNRVRIHSSSQFEKENSEISDSKLPYHRDIFIVADPSNKYKSEAQTALATEPKVPLPKNPTHFVPTISSSLCKREDDEENMKMDSTSCTSTTDEPSLMNMNSASNSYENPEIYASSLCCDQKITPTSSVSDGCEAERISSDSSFFNSSDYDDLLEYYGLSNQDQYTDTGYSCASPTWSGKSERQIQKSQTCLASNLTKDDYANRTLTADSSLFHSNTDETSVMNKNWTDDIYERNSENSVSQYHLNQMRCAFETSSLDDNAGSIDYRMIFDPCVYDVSSINKFSSSIQLLDLISCPFDISNHDKLLEWYGINDQDQFVDGNWICDSPTWPGKM
ncbi:hypothetical protein CAEBREN_25992 [Caenorhabditis brenneri]|uniref:Uncharacterized protein n=1 Tax=Caenorhabditis brenneri TaxID=135651 RepID=G0NNM3_CAEBE|nr:hypothetical protein CAEBREN_25992 [Caenorhabditis brenneri]